MSIGLPLKGVSWYYFPFFKVQNANMFVSRACPDKEEQLEQD